MPSSMSPLVGILLWTLLIAPKLSFANPAAQSSNSKPSIPYSFSLNVSTAHRSFIHATSAGWNNSSTTSAHSLQTGAGTGALSASAPNTTAGPKGNATSICAGSICLENNGLYSNGSSITAPPPAFYSSCYSAYLPYYLSSWYDRWGLLQSIPDLFNHTPITTEYSTVSVLTIVSDISTTHFASYSTASNGLVYSFTPTASSLVSQTTTYSAEVETILEPKITIPTPNFPCCSIADYEYSKSAKDWSLGSLAYASWTASLISSVEKSLNVSPSTTFYSYQTSYYNSLFTSWPDPAIPGNKTQYYLWDGDLRLSLPTSTYYANVTTVFSQGPFTTGFTNYTFPPVEVAVGTSPWACGNTLGNIGITQTCGQCTIYANNVQLMYWPVSLTWSGSISSIIPQTPATTTAVVGGSTLTYPTVYLSYAAISASNSCNNIGPTQTGKIIPIGTGAVEIENWPINNGAGESYFSQDGIPLSTTMGPGDLSPNPIPASIYQWQEQCQHIFDCSAYIIDPLPFIPQLVVPAQLTSLYPEWASCNPYIAGSFDPPTALQPADAIASATPPPSSAPSTPAAAGSTVAPITPAATTTQAPAQTSLVPQSSAGSVGGSGQGPSSASSIAPEAESTAVASSTGDNIASIIASVVGATSISDAEVSAGETATTVQDSSPAPAATNAAPGSSNALSVLIPAESTAAAGHGSSAVDPATSQAPATGDPSTAADPNSPSAVPDPGSVAPEPVATVDGASQPAASDPSAPIASVGGVGVSADPSGNGVVAGGTTLTPGQITAINSVPVSVGTNAIAAGSSTIAIPAPNPAPTSPETVITAIGGATISADPSGSGVVVAGQTLAPGQVTTINNTPVSVGTGNVVVAGFALAVASPAQPLPAVTSVGGVVLSAAPSGSDIIVGSTTLQPGEATVINNTPVSVGTGSVVLGGSTLQIPSAATGGAVATLGGLGVSADPTGGNGVVIAGATLTPGVTTEINNTPVSVGTGNIVVAGSTYAVPSAAVSAVTSVGSEPIYTDPAGGGGILIGSQTLDPGQVTVIDGTSVSVGTDDVVIAGSTLALPSDAAAPAASGYVVDGQTISAGGSDFVQQGTYSALASGSGVVVAANGVSSTITNAAADGITPIALPSLVSAESAYIIDGSTVLFGGSAVTDQGTTYSVLSGGSALVVVASGVTSTFSDAGSVPLTLGGGVVATPTGVPIPIAQAPSVSVLGNDVIVGSVTLSAGGSALTMDGQTISVASSGVVYDGSTMAFTAGSGSSIAAEIMSGLQSGIMAGAASGSASNSLPKITSGPAATSAQSPAKTAASSSTSAADRPLCGSWMMVWAIALTVLSMI